MNCSLYIARCSDRTLYVGISNNVDERIIRHNKGLGSLWIKAHGNAEIVYQEDFDNYTDARTREVQLKKWSAIKKEALISGNIQKLKDLSKSRS